MKEHPDIVKFYHFSAYVRTRSAGILRGLTPWHTDFGTKSSVLHLVRGVQAPGTHVRSDYSQTCHTGGRPSSHKANLIPQSKRQDTTVIVIPCLCSFNALCSPSAELPINKKRTRTLFRKESGSSTNCMVDGTGLEQHGHAAGGVTNTPVGCLLVRGSQCVGMSIKKDAARPLVWGLFSWWAVQDENRDKQRQGITIMVLSCLLLFLTVYGILDLVQRIGI